MKSFVYMLIGIIGIIIGFVLIPFVIAWRIANRDVDKMENYLRKFQK